MPSSQAHRLGSKTFSLHISPLPILDLVDPGSEHASRACLVPVDAWFHGNLKESRWHRAQAQAFAAWTRLLDPTARLVMPSSYLIQL